MPTAQCPHPTQTQPCELARTYHVDVVADAGAVHRVVVVPEDAELGATPHCNLADVRYQVVRDALWVLTDPAAGVSADWIEVAQQDDVPFRIGGREVPADLLNKVLGLAVRIGAAADRVVLVNRVILWVAVDSGRRREYEVLAAAPRHRREREYVVPTAAKG